MIISGKYEVLDKIGQGGMGVVYRVHHTDLDRDFALKVLPQYLIQEEDFVERFRREAQLMARLEHKNIVRVYDLARDGNTYFLVMELVRGKNLRQVLHQSLQEPQRSLPIDTVLRLGIDVADALVCAHGQKPAVVHRDIKPSNIIIEDDTGRAVVTDFGIAKLMGEAATQSDLTRVGFVGTPKYCAPEQLRHDEVDGRVDLYSLGLVIYEAYTGQQYFGGVKDHDLIRRVLYESGENTVALPDAPPAFTRLIERAIARDREARYQTAEALLADLRALAATIGESDGATITSGSGLVANSIRVEASPRSTIGRLTGAMREWFSRKAAGDVEGTTESRGSIVAPASTDEVAPTSGSGGAAVAPSSVDGRSEVDAPATVPPAIAPAAPPPLQTTPPDPNEATVLLPRGAVPLTPSPAVTPTSAPIESSETRLGEETAAFAVPPHSETGASQPAASALEVGLTIVRYGDSRRLGTRVGIEKFPFRIGRAGDGLCLAVDPAISGEHAAIEYENGRFSILDCDSANGTFVNGRRLQRGRAEPLSFGASILLGANTELVFDSELLKELPDLTGTELAGRFTLMEKLHTSAKAVLYAARDRELGRTVALKVLAPGLAQHPGYREQFEREAQLASRLSHPNICTIFQYGAAELPTPARGESLYVSMALMKGGNLSSRIADGRTVDQRDVVSWLRPICDALDYVHREKIVHGSIKPSAIVFDASTHPYVTDFALATVTGENERRMLLGAPAFLAPEQWLGEEPGPATDQYSLAVVTYRMVTGALPYEGQDRPEVREQNLMRGPLAAHEMAARKNQAQLPASVSEVLGRALATDPSARYASAVDFGSELTTALINPVRKETRLPSIFISYHRKTSSGWVVYFKDKLEEHHGCRVFVDIEQRDTAGRFPARIERRVRQCDVFVCLLSDTALDSEWVQREVALAAEAGKPMIPVFQEGFAFPIDPSGLPPAVRELLEYEGVPLPNMYVDAAIERLGRMIKDLTGPSS